MTPSPSTPPEARKPETGFETLARERYGVTPYGSERDRIAAACRHAFVAGAQAAHTALSARLADLEKQLEGLRESGVEKILAMSHDEIRALSIIEGSHADIDAATAETAIYKAIASAAKTRLAEIELERDGFSANAAWNRRALTTSAAAEAAMREALAEAHRCDINYNVFDCPTGGYMRKKIDAALATPSALAERMMRVIEAARTFDAALHGDGVAACNTELRALREALRALGETGET